MQLGIDRTEASRTQQRRYARLARFLFLAVILVAFAGGFILSRIAGSETRVGLTGHAAGSPKTIAPSRRLGRNEGAYTRRKVVLPKGCQVGHSVWFKVGVQFIMEQAPHIRTFWDTNSHLKKGDRYIQVSQRENKEGNFEIQHSTGEVGGMRGEPVFMKYKSLLDAQREFDRLCTDALEHGCSWEHNESIHGRIVIDFTNWPSIALW